MSDRNLEQDKQALLERIDAHRTDMSSRFADVRRSFAPVNAVRGVIRNVVPLIRPVSVLATSVKKGRKGRVGMWLRVGLVATMLVPVVRALVSNRGDADAGEGE